MISDEMSASCTRQERASGARATSSLSLMAGTVRDPEYREEGRGR